MNKKKNLIISISIVFVAGLFLAFLLIKGNNKPGLQFSVGNGDSATGLIALDANAKRAMIKKTGTACYKFSEEQMNQIADVYDKNKSAAVKIRINLDPTSNQQEFLITQGHNFEFPLYFGLLYDEDFSKKGKLSADLKEKISVNADISRMMYNSFEISIALSKKYNDESNIPSGFFIKSSIQCNFEDVRIIPAVIGFDVRNEVPFYAFSPNGGKISYDNSTVDFSGAPIVFPVQNTSEDSMPQITATMLDKEEFKSDGNNSVRTKVNFGGERVYIKNVKKADKLVIPSSALKNPFVMADISENKECLTSLLMSNTFLSSKPIFERSSTEVYEPIVTDPGLILDYPQKNWRIHDYEIYEWDRYPGILFFDTVDYDFQSKMFSRIAFFVEKEGYKGTLITNEELEGKHGYNAHDYSAESLAKFFQKADEERFVLNKEEETLRKVLLANGLLVLADDGVRVEAGRGGLVSISRETPDWSRANLLAHEGWHTLFFRDEEFRNFVSAVYYMMDPLSLDFMIDYFKSQPGLGYDVNDEYLMHNEFMAYLMQQKLSGVAEYFVHLANRGSVIEYTPDLAFYVRRTKGAGFEDAASMLNDFCFDTYGVVCGNISLVQR